MSHPELEEFLSEDLGFRIATGKNGVRLFDESVDFEQAAEDPLHLLALGNSKKIYAASNIKSVGVGYLADLDDLESAKLKLRCVEFGPTTCLALDSTNEYLYVVSESNAHIGSVSQLLEGNSAEFSPITTSGNVICLATSPSVPGSYFYLKSDNTLTIVIGASEVHVSDINNACWDISGQFIGAVSDESFYILDSKAAKTETHSISDAGKLSGVSCIDSKNWLVVASPEDEDDMHFLVSSGSSAGITSVPFAPPFGEAERAKTLYATSLLNWIQGTSYSFVTSALSTEINTVECGSNVRLVAQLNETDRAELPMDDESGDDTLPVGLAVDISATLLTVKAPCDAVEEAIGVLPRLLCLNNLGYLIVWYVFDSAGLRNNTLSLQRALETIDPNASKIQSTGQSQPVSNPTPASTNADTAPSASDCSNAPNAFGAGFGKSGFGAATSTSGSGFGSTGFGAASSTSTGAGSTGFGSAGFGAASSGAPTFGHSSFGQPLFGSGSAFGLGGSKGAAPAASTTSNFAKFASPATFASSKSSDSPFGSTKPATDSPFGSTKPSSDSPFGSTKPSSDSPFGSTIPSSDSPFGSTKPSSDSPFGSVKPAADSPFGTVKPSGDSPFAFMPASGESPFGSSKPSGDSPFGSAKPFGESPFGAAKPDGKSETGTTELSTTAKPEAAKPTDGFLFGQPKLSDQSPFGANPFGAGSFGTDPTKSFNSDANKKTGTDSAASNITSAFGSSGFSIGSLKPDKDQPSPFDVLKKTSAENDTEKILAGEEKDSSKAQEAKPAEATVSASASKETTQAEKSSETKSAEETIKAPVEPDKAAVTEPKAKTADSTSKGEMTLVPARSSDLKVVKAGESSTLEEDSDEVPSKVEFEPLLIFGGWSSEPARLDNEVSNKMAELLAHSAAGMTVLRQNAAKIDKLIRFCDSAETDFSIEDLAKREQWPLGAVEQLTKLAQGARADIQADLLTARMQDKDLSRLLDLAEQSEDGRQQLFKAISQIALFKQDQTSSKVVNRPLDVKSNTMRSRLRRKVSEVNSNLNMALEKMVPLLMSRDVNQELVKKLRRAVYEVHARVRQYSDDMERIEQMLAHTSALPIEQNDSNYLTNFRDRKWKAAAKLNATTPRKVTLNTI